MSLTINNILCTHCKFIIQFCQTRTPGVDYTESIPCEKNQFRCGIDSWRHRFQVKEVKISKLLSSCIVCGGINTFPTRKNMAAVGRGWKVDSSFKNMHFMGHWLIRFHTWFLLSSRNRFSPIALLKITTQSRKLQSRYGARNRFQEPSLELSIQATGGPVRQPYAYLVPSPHRGT